MAISERSDTFGDSGPSRWAGQCMTIEEFLALPEQKPALEYEAGTVTQKMAPTPDHIELQAILREAFNATAEQHHFGRAFAEVRFRASDVAYVPDVGYYRRERLRTRPGHRYARDLGLPDIAVEIVSPEQSVTSLIRKCQRYLALGASIALLVDPDDETVLAFRLGQPVRVLRADDRIEVDDVLPGLTLTVRELFDAIVPRWVEEPDVSAEQSLPNQTTEAGCCPLQPRAATIEETFTNYLTPGSASRLWLSTCGLANGSQRVQSRQYGYRENTGRGQASILDPAMNQPV